MNLLKIIEKTFLGEYLMEFKKKRKITIKKIQSTVKKLSSFGNKNKSKK